MAWNAGKWALCKKTKPNSININLSYSPSDFSEEVAEGVTLKSLYWGPGSPPSRISQILADPFANSPAPSRREAASTALALSQQHLISPAQLRLHHFSRDVQLESVWNHYHAVGWILSKPVSLTGSNRNHLCWVWTQTHFSGKVTTA